MTFVGELNAEMSDEFLQPTQPPNLMQMFLSTQALRKAELYPQKCLELSLIADSVKIPVMAKRYIMDKNGSSNAKLGKKLAILPSCASVCSEGENMPFIMSKVNIPLNSEQEFKLKSRLGKVMEFLPGLSEKYLLAGFESNHHFYLRGDNTQPIAFIEVSIFANENHIGYEDFSAAITKIFFEILHIPPQNIYLKFNDIAAWSVGGIFFDRR